ncbi:MAG TPA: N-acetyltransferase, partial [Verrucomicrobiae bacterium]|jgi:hypothetical protein
LIQGLQREAAAAKKPVRLCVFAGERASRLYQRLGFRKTGHAAGRDQMEWQLDDLTQKNSLPCGQP